MRDAIDLTAARFHASPNVALWPITVALEGVEFSPGERNGVRPIFNRHTMNARWPDIRPEGWDGLIQFCLWAFVKVNGVWHGAALLEFWSDRNGAPRLWTGAPFLETGEKGGPNWQENWVYRTDIYDPMHQCVMAPGTEVGFMLTSGNVRDPHNDPSVSERSNVILVKLAGAGMAEIVGGQPEPIAPPVEPPVIQPPVIQPPVIQPPVIHPPIVQPPITAPVQPPTDLSAISQRLENQAASILELEKAVKTLNDLLEAQQAELAELKHRGKPVAAVGSVVGVRVRLPIEFEQ